MIRDHVIKNNQWGLPKFHSTLFINCTFHVILFQCCESFPGMIWDFFRVSNPRAVKLPWIFLRAHWLPEISRVTLTGMNPHNICFDYYAYHMRITRCHPAYCNTAPAGTSHTVLKFIDSKIFEKQLDSFFLYVQFLSKWNDTITRVVHSYRYNIVTGKYIYGKETYIL